jgi:hypothetical protein
MTSPTTLSLNYCRKLEWPVEVVEQKLFVPFGPRQFVAPIKRVVQPFFMTRRKDLFGCIDILALDGEMGVLGIQACAAGDISTRTKKALDQPHIRRFLELGNRFEVWGWKQKKKGARWRRVRRVIAWSGAELVVMSPLD